MAECKINTHALNKKREKSVYKKIMFINIMNKFIIKKIKVYIIIFMYLSFFPFKIMITYLY